MLTAKQEQKIHNLYENWLNGNKKAAAKTVRSLTKLELFDVLSSFYYADCKENRESFLYSFIHKVLSDKDYCK